MHCAKKMGELPAPFSLAVPCAQPYDISFFALRKQDGTRKIVKRLELADKTRYAFLLQVFRGAPHVIDWHTMTNQRRTNLKVLQYDCVQMGGYSMRSFELSTTPTKEDPLDDPDAVDVGVEFVIEQAPRSNIDLKQFVWSTK